MVTINNPDVDPSSGLIQLTAKTIDPNQKIITSCQADRANGFTVTGKGGFSEDPLVNLRGDNVWNDLRLVRVPLSPKDQNRITTQNLQRPDSILEAQAWIINTRGNFELVTVTPTNSAHAIANCQDLTTEINKKD